MVSPARAGPWHDMAGPGSRDQGQRPYYAALSLRQAIPGIQAVSDPRLRTHARGGVTCGRWQWGKHSDSR